MPLRIALFAWIGVATAASAQVPADSVALPSVRVEAVRSADAASPFSVAVEARDRFVRAVDPGVSLGNALRTLPGAVLSDRQNPGLGERLSVRGLGARSAFGVRGVQVVLDGVPLTLADGQATLATVDPAFVRRAELVRGPASALWGNGSGGVLFLGTVPEADVASARLLGGAYGLRRAEAEVAARVGRHRAGVALSHTEREGYRAYSALRTTRGRIFSDFRLSPATSLGLVGAFDVSPLQENPGALTAEQLADDRRQPEARYVGSRSGKDSAQGQVAATLRTDGAHGRMTATAYGVARRLDNPLPFAVIHVGRLAGGTRLAWERDAGPVRIGLGADAAVQRDDRTNRPNEGGTPGATLTLDQAEAVTQAGAFVRARVSLGRLGPAALSLDGALRADRIRFEARDGLLADGDQSGERTLGALSPQIGLGARVGPVLLFASWATAFETPTTTELVNRPGGGGGFNPDLRPQRTSGGEVGVRAAARRLFVDVAIYSLSVCDGLTPTEDVDGRTVYLNRGRTQHRGVEALVDVPLAAGIEATAAYTWSRLTFADGEAAGNRLPGVPAHRLSARLRVERGGWFVMPDVEAASGLWADDANTARTDAFAAVDLAVGHTGIRVGGVRLGPFARVSNALGAAYVGSVAINARGGRFYEPAAGRGVVAGLTVRPD